MADVAFVPLRTDPPPRLGSTIWTRSALPVGVAAALVSVLVGEYRAVDVRTDPAVIALHLVVLALLMVWSRVAIANVDRIVPSTRYGAGGSGPLAALLWVIGWAAPVAAVWVWSRLGSRFADVEAFVPTVATIGVVVVALVTLWLPFRYHVRQGRRIKVPVAKLLLWFWAPLVSFVAGTSVLALGVDEALAADGYDGLERMARTSLTYGLATAVFGAATWRAVTVFDEVIDLRWERWRVEWEQTLAAMAAQPAPGPERG